VNFAAPRRANGMETGGERLRVRGPQAQKHVFRRSAPHTHPTDNWMTPLDSPHLTAPGEVIFTATTSAAGDGGLCLVAVSRFFCFPIQMNFAENQK
jgi:hypothetical protein